MLTLHRELLRLRRAHPALRRGGYEAIDARGDVLLIVRGDGDERIAVAMNLGEQEVEVALPAEAAAVLLATQDVPAPAAGGLRLAPLAATILTLGA